jgi:hypothetical protein
VCWLIWTKTHTNNTFLYRPVFRKEQNLSLQFFGLQIYLYSMNRKILWRLFKYECMGTYMFFEGVCVFFTAILSLYLEIIRSRSSSVSIVSDYGLEDREIGVRSSAGAKYFSSSLCVQNGSGAHPASCSMGTEGPFRGGKARPGRDADHSPSSSAEVVNV